MDGLRPAFAFEFDFEDGGVEEPKPLVIFLRPFWLDRLAELLFLLLPLGVFTGVAGGEAIC